MATEVQQQNHARQASRRLLVQAVYQWQLNDSDYEALLSQFADDEHWSRIDHAYFCQLLRGIIDRYDDLVASVQACADRPFAQIDVIERSILLIATYELLHCPKTPSKVVITEAIRLAKKFGAADGFRYVNAVLDKLAA